MGILLTTWLLLTGALALAALRALRPRFRFTWLLALGVSLAAWLSTLAMRIQLPIRLEVPLWDSSTSNASFASFTVGGATWLHILGIASMVVALLLAAPGRPRFPAPATWAVCLAFGALGVLALAADGPLTLVLFWASLDLAEAGLVLTRMENRSRSRQVPRAFALRLGSIGLVILAFVLGDAGSAGAKFGEMQSPMSLALLPTAALLRLGALAMPGRKEAEMPTDELDTMLQLTAGAAAVGFLAQLQARPGALIILLACAGAALYAGWMFVRAPDFETARSQWIMGIGSLAVAASLLANPLGAAAWGCAILLVGSPLFISSSVDRWARRALVIGLWTISALPFSLTATAWFVPGIGWIWMLPFFLAAQAMLLAGCFHRALSSQTGLALRMEVVALKGIQYAGVGLPILIGVLLGLGGWPGAPKVGAAPAGVLLIPLAAGLAFAKRRLPALNPASEDWLPSWISLALGTVQREGSRVGGSLQRLAGAITSTMEGEAGIMWGLLFLVLFVSLIVGGSR